MNDFENFYVYDSTDPELDGLYCPRCKTRLTHDEAWIYFEKGPESASFK